MIDSRLRTEWNKEWNHSDEFWCCLDSSGIIVMANSSFKEWFEVSFNQSIIGIHPGSNMGNNSNFNYQSTDWQVVHRTSRMVRTPTREDIKLVYCGKEYVGALVKLTYKDKSISALDLDAAQDLLDNHNGASTKQPTNVVNLFG